ncbi:UNVERIFIED_CONTAM: Retrovirus-related Pol polyprotein from transposon RE2 [Sesamum radiatum]|uniref:Retrovirus-related Pol polyprotein from transposon RE2 n=1 Tax=Sesamum radiatum TaxID=300843 RepID=A0AAW2TYN2_SESRA
MVEMKPIQPPNKPSDITHPRRKSARVSKQLERYGMLALTGQLDNDPKTFEEAMSDINSGTGLKLEVSTFKARLVAKGYTQRPSVDFEKTYLPVAMAKSIRILLARAAYHDYEIWQMDVKIAFVNGFIEEKSI